MFASLKRRAGDDEGEDGRDDLGFDRSLDRKKRRMLPFRPSPISTNHAFALESFAFIATQPTPITPGPPDSDGGSSSARRSLFSPGQTASARSRQSSPSLPDLSQSDDFDLDMCDSLPNVGSPPCFLVSSPPQAHARLPTPMFGSFFLHPSAARPGADDMPLDEAADPTTQYRHMARRRLPSPISEGEDGTASPLGGAGEMMGRLGVGGAGGMGSIVGRLVEADEEDEAMAVAGAVMATATATDLAVAAEPDDKPEEGAGDRQRRGRSRSRRADGKDRLEGKPVLSMGYRADCEKCRARVPGHYSHVIRG
ncbi:MAG: hypothetical protein M1832_004348 [Thelocarpon impressellum]|nr:MAG: hypothetical protein M1832_004348 [Thelocarpon impressellum]